VSANEKRAAWLASLAPGMKVALDVTGYGRTERRLVARTVVRVTPTIIHLNVPTRDDLTTKIDRATGDEKGGGRWDWRGSIEPISDEIRAGWRRDRALRAASEIKWDSLTTEQIEAVLAALPPKETP
jgi:hypothetical protein